MCFEEEILSIAEGSMINESEEEHPIKDESYPYVVPVTYSNVYKLWIYRNQTLTVAYFVNCGHLGGDNFLMGNLICSK